MGLVSRGPTSRRAKSPRGNEEESLPGGRVSFTPEPAGRGSSSARRQLGSTEASSAKAPWGDVKGMTKLKPAET